MHNIGKNIRLGKFTRHSWNTILAIDHGFTHGPLLGIESIDNIVQMILALPLQGIVMHQGMLDALYRRDVILSDLGIIIQLTANNKLSSQVDDKLVVADVMTAVRCGADAVAVQLNFTRENFGENIRLLSHIKNETEKYSLPILAMIYISDEEINSIENYKVILRMCVEMGIDMIKIPQPRSNLDLDCLLSEASKDCYIFLAGGNKSSLKAIEDTRKAAISSGASGFCMGRNIFQRDNYLELFDVIDTKVRSCIHECLI